MKHGFYTRLLQVEILIGAAVAVLMVGLFIYFYAGAGLLLLYKVAVLVLSGAMLFNPRAYAFLKSKFPALRDYIIRCVIVGCVLMVLAGSDATPEDGYQYYLLMAQGGAGGFLLFTAHMGALLDF